MISIVVVEEGGRFGEYERLEVSENFIAHSKGHLPPPASVDPTQARRLAGLRRAIGVLSWDPGLEYCYGLIARDCLTIHARADCRCSCGLCIRLKLRPVRFAELQSVSIGAQKSIHGWQIVVCCRGASSGVCTNVWLALDLSRRERPSHLRPTVHFKIFFLGVYEIFAFNSSRRGPGSWP